MYCFANSKTEELTSSNLCVSMRLHKSDAGKKAASVTYQVFIKDCFQEDNSFAVKEKYLQDFACFVPDTENAASVKCLTKEDFIRFFREQRGGFSCAAFRKNRRLLENLFLLFCQYGIAEKSQVEQVRSVVYSDIASAYDNIYKFYFKDLEELDTFLYTLRFDIDPLGTADLLDFRALLYLLWYGVDTKDLIHIKKEDLHPDDCSVFLHRTNRFIYFDKEPFALLCRHAQAEGKVDKMGKRYNYITSDYLMRSKFNVQLTANALAQQITWINHFAKKYHKVLQINKIRINGKFVRIYTQKKAILQQSPTANAEAEAIKAVNGDNGYSLREFKKMYLMWEGFFYS